MKAAKDGRTGLAAETQKFDVNRSAKEGINSASVICDHSGMPYSLIALYILSANTSSVHLY